MPSSDIPQLQALANAVENLTYPSESDEPFEVFHWKGSSNTSATQAIEQHTAAGRKVNSLTVDDFFSELDDSDDAPRFGALRRVLESQLRELAACRVGEGQVDVDVYILGRLPDSDWAGLHTRSVET